MKQTFVGSSLSKYNYFVSAVIKCTLAWLCHVYSLSHCRLLTTISGLTLPDISFTCFKYRKKESTGIKKGIFIGWRPELRCWSLYWCLFAPLVGCKVQHFISGTSYISLFSWPGTFLMLMQIFRVQPSPTRLLKSTRTHHHMQLRSQSMRWKNWVYKI